ncbi:MAG TPA: hypothetical protein VNC22_04130 [Sporichthya sp.]|nr:hypothetical protein [Sporichthya sp.]
MNALKDWLETRRTRLTWLDCDRYVWSVFAGAPERWYSDPGTMIGAIAQAHKLLRSDVLTVDLQGAFSRHLSSAGTAAEIVDALEGEEPRRDLSSAVDALAHQFAGSVDLVLDCPSPRRLFPPGADADLDDLDDVASALLDVVRSLADRPLAGLQITCDTAPGPDEDEADSWSSLLSAARHYGWVTVIRLNALTDPEQLDPGWPGDLVLLPRLDAEAVPDDVRHGAGLPPEAWADSPDAVRTVDAAAKRGFRFGEIPGDASPEIVLDRIRALS